MQPSWNSVGAGAPRERAPAYGIASMGLKIGIGVGDTALGSAGGLDVYTRTLVEALDEHEHTNQYFVLLREKGKRAESRAREAWLDRKWSRNVRFIIVRDHALPPTRREIWQRRILRRLRMEPPQIPDTVEEYRAYQIDRLRLNLVHFPRTAISPLCLGTPALLTFFDLQHEYFPEFFTPAERLGRTTHFRAAIAKARHIIAPSEYTKHTLNETYGVLNSKMSVVPVGISRSFQRVPPHEIERVRAKYNLPQEFIFYPANPWRHKNHQRLFQSLRLYRERYGQAPKLVLSGRLRGEQLDALSLAEQEGVADLVIDLGFFPRADSAAIFSAATMLVFPSLFEGFGIPLIEAMACECPIAAADATAIPECVQDSALLFNPLDVNEMTDAIYRVMNDATWRATLVARGRVRVQRYHWERVIPELLLVYRQTMLLSQTGQT